MMRSMFGIRYIAPTGLLISWLCHFIGLHPMLRYATLSALHHHSPERALYNSEVVSPLAEYNSEAVMPLATLTRWASPLAVKTEKL